MDELQDDGLGTPSCPRCLTLLQDEGDAFDGSDAYWRCPTCGYVSLV